MPASEDTGLSRCAPGWWPRRWARSTQGGWHPLGWATLVIMLARGVHGGGHALTGECTPTPGHPAGPSRPSAFAGGPCPCPAEPRTLQPPRSMLSLGASAEGGWQEDQWFNPFFLQSGQSGRGGGGSVGPDGCPTHGRHTPAGATGQGRRLEGGFALRSQRWPELVCSNTTCCAGAAPSAGSRPDLSPAVPTKPGLERRAPLSGPRGSPSLPPACQGPSVTWRIALPCTTPRFR